MCHAPFISKDTRRCGDYHTTIERLLESSNACILPLSCPLPRIFTPFPNANRTSINLSTPMDICTRSVPRLRTRPSVRGLSFALYRLRRQSVRGMSHISARGHLHAVCPPCALRRQSVRGLSHISVRGHLHAVRPTCSARALPISSPTSLHVAICTRSVPYLMLCTRFTRALSNQLTLSHGSPHTHSCRRLYVCPPSQFSCLPSLVQSHWRLATGATPARRPPVTMGHSPD